ncbi:MAG: IS200/IS605 family transposase [Saprospiraceae bacterium]|nr:IS200/IS605 family transposase [Saprospiraceae bacterium]
MGQSYHALWVHLIWGTKYRQPLILPEWKFKLYDQLRDISKEKGYYLDFINGVEDHVHLLMGLKPTHTVANMAKNLKGISQTWVRKNDLSDEYFHWQDGYAAISVSPKQVQSVRRYIENQERHHRKITFEEEWNGLKKQAIIV